MKKIFYYGLIFVLITSCVSLKYLNKFDDFKGKPKEVIVKTYRIVYENDSVLQKQGSGYKLIFDRRGRYTNFYWENRGKGYYNCDWSYFYDNQGNNVKSIKYSGSCIENFRLEKEYNKYGQIIVEKRFNSDSLVRITKYNIDRENYTSDYIVKDVKGKLIAKSVFHYDSKWNKKESINYDVGKNGEILNSSKIVNEYDKNGNKIASSWFGTNNKIHTIYRDNYDANNLKIHSEKVKIVNGKEKIIRTNKYVYEYDFKGNVIKEIFHQNSKPISIEKKFYVYH